MARTKLVCAGAAQIIAADRYFHIVGRPSTTAITTESYTQITFNQAGVISNFSVNITANTTTACAFYVRQNAGNSSVTVSYTSGQTGIKEDTTNTLTVAAGDEINYFADVTSGSSITVANLNCSFDSNSYTYQLFAAVQTPLGQNDGITRYYSINNLNAQSTESNTQFEILLPGNFQHFFVNVTANTHTTASSTFDLRVNASATGCPSIVYTFGQTGIKEETSTVKAVVDADDCNFRLVTGANSGTTTITFSTISCGFYNILGKYMETCILDTAAIAANNTIYYPINSILSGSSTESLWEITLRNNDNLVTELFVNSTANTITTSPTTIVYRVNRGGNTLEISYPAGISGVKSTLGGTRVGNGDEVDYRLITPATTGTFTFRQLSSLYQIMPQFYQLNKFSFNDIDEGEEIG